VGRVRWSAAGGSRRSVAEQVPGGAGRRAVEDLTPEERTDRTTRLAAAPTLRDAQPLAADVEARGRPRAAPGLPAWLDRAEARGLPEACSCAAGIRRDRAAVDAALSSVWSTGQPERQITRLRVLKRQRSGRATLELLEKRFRSAA
jgi:transposase